MAHLIERSPAERGYVERSGSKPEDGVAFYAFLAVLVNWHYSRAETTVHEGGAMSTTLNFDGGGLIALVCAVSLFFVGRSLYRQVRGLLAEGKVVPRNLRLWVWWPCALVFLFFFQISGAQSSAGGGHSIATEWGYGSKMPGMAAIFFLAWMIVYQIRGNLRRYVEGR